MLKIYISTIIICLAQVVTIAQVWNGDGDGVSWGDADNWSTDAVPSSSQTALIADATVVVSDQYIVQKVTLDDATLQVSTNSGLTIKGSTANGLDMSGSTLTIDGILTVRDFAVFGIKVSTISDINVSSTGRLKIRAGGNFGIDFQAGDFYNEGEVNIEDALIGISNYSTIVNNGSFLIDQFQLMGIDHREGTLKNCVGGNIMMIADTTTAAIGLDLGGRLANEGKLEFVSCYNSAIRLNQDTLINIDSLIMTDCRFGINGGVVTSTSFVENRTDGVILFQQPNVDNPSVALQTYGKLTNFGLIKIEGIADFGIQLYGDAGLINNFGRMESSTTYEADFITNEGTFINQIGGEVVINSDGTPDFGIVNSSVFINRGAIAINLPSSQGSCIASGFVDNTYFENSGSLSIEGGRRGISHRDRNTFVNTLSGEISIVESRIAIRSLEMATFSNQNIIHIESAIFAGLQIEGNSSFVNSDSIIINDSYRSIAMEGSMENLKYISIRNGKNVGLRLTFQASFENDQASFMEIEADSAIVIAPGGQLDFQGTMTTTAN